MIDQTNQDYLNSNIQITDMIEDSVGFLWISTESDGLFRYHHEKDSLVRLTVEDGLKSNKISFFQLRLKKVSFEKLE